MLLRKLNFPLPFSLVPTIFPRVSGISHGVVPHCGFLATVTICGREEQDKQLWLCSVLSGLMQYPGNTTPCLTICRRLRGGNVRPHLPSGFIRPHPTSEPFRAFGESAFEVSPCCCSWLQRFPNSAFFMYCNILGVGELKNKIQQLSCFGYFCGYLILIQAGLGFLTLLPA